MAGCCRMAVHSKLFPLRHSIFEPTPLVFLSLNDRNKRYFVLISGVILEIEGSVRQRYKRALFPYKKLYKGASDLSNPYVHSTFALLLMKQIFESHK